MERSLPCQNIQWCSFCYWPTSLLLQWVCFTLADEQPPPPPCWFHSSRHLNVPTNHCWALTSRRGGAFYYLLLHQSFAHYAVSLPVTAWRGQTRPIKNHHFGRRGQWLHLHASYNKHFTQHKSKGSSTRARTLRFIGASTLQLAPAQRQQGDETSTPTCRIWMRVL